MCPQIPGLAAHDKLIYKHRTLQFQPRSVSRKASLLISSAACRDSRGTVPWGRGLGTASRLQAQKHTLLHVCTSPSPAWGGGCVLNSRGEPWKTALPPTVGDLTHSHDLAKPQFTHPQNGVRTPSARGCLQSTEPGPGTGRLLSGHHGCRSSSHSNDLAVITAGPLHSDYRGPGAIPDGLLWVRELRHRGAGEKQTSRRQTWGLQPERVVSSRGLEFKALLFKYRPWTSNPIPSLVAGTPPTPEV